MPVLSAVDAVFQKYNDLPGALEPILWFGQAQMIVPGGGTTDFPILEYYHEASNFQTTFENVAIQQDTFRFEAWGETIAEVRALLEGIMWGGSSPESRLGFWYAATFPTPTGWVYLSCDPDSEPQYETIIDPQSANAKQLHHGVFRFTTQFKR
jgi:hypothetical protein